MNPPDKEKGIIIPHRELSPEALQGLIEEYVTRGGTDDGYTRLTLDQRMDRVRRRLAGGEACIVYDPATGTANIIPRKDLPAARGPDPV